MFPVIIENNLNNFIMSVRYVASTEKFAQKVDEVFEGCLALVKNMDDQANDMTTQDVADHKDFLTALKTIQTTDPDIRTILDELISLKEKGNDVNHFKKHLK